MGETPVFAEGRVTELAGPGLRVETALQLHPGDRVLVVFTPDRGNADVPGGWGTIAGIGRVRHCHGTDSEKSIAIELMGLSDTEIDELAYITAAMASREDEGWTHNQTQTTEVSAPVVGAAKSVT